MKSGSNQVMTWTARAPPSFSSLPDLVWPVPISPDESHPTRYGDALFCCRATMIGVLAYGSLITDPGPELEAVTIDTVKGVLTPFCVNFARSSRKRGGAPTLVPVAEGGSQVQAVIFKVEGSARDIADIVYRREIHAVGSGKTYTVPPPHRENAVRIARIEGLAGFDVVLATQIAANISPLSAEILADLAIASARELSDGRDGISYLIAARASGIVTRLSPAYERAILEKTTAADLHAALHAIDPVRGCRPRA